MNFFENYKSDNYDKTIDNAIKTELKDAGIPVIELPYYMWADVKTRHIGILNGFVFHRTNTCWMCDGNMPLKMAHHIYRSDWNEGIRAGGLRADTPPDDVAHNLNCENKDITQPRFVSTYHIDTEEGLKRIASVIKDYGVYSDRE